MHLFKFCSRLGVRVVIGIRGHKNGNRTKTGGSFARTGIPSAVSSTNYNAANQQTTFGDKVLTYDNNGNLQTITDSSGTTTYTWNARNQLTGISGPGMSATFVYDGLGRREKKTVNSNLTEFLYDGFNPVQETSGTTVLANVLSGLGVDEYLTRTDVPAATTNHFLPDVLGSAVALTDAAGAVQSEYTYEPFGRTTSTGASNTNPFHYTGRENDGTGLYHYRARYYHPQLQRFIAEDSIDFAGGDVNLYAYVTNNPSNLIDPDGLTWSSNLNFLADWVTGAGSADRRYGPDDVEGREMMNSPGAQALRREYAQGGCRGVPRFAYGSAQAAKDTLLNPVTADWSSTAAQVGGFAGASAVNNGNGTVTYTIPNVAGANSFFYHRVPNVPWSNGPMRNIQQTFQSTEPSQCKSPGRGG